MERPEPGARLHDEVGVIGHREVHDDVALGHEVRSKPFHRLLGFQPQRIVGLDAENQVHAALQVETKLELLVHEGRWPVDPVAGSHDWVDANRGECDEGWRGR